MSGERSVAMKNVKWQIALSGSLVLLTSGLYFLHFLIFHDARHIFIYLLGDIAFLPLQVLFVTLIINRCSAIGKKRPS